MNLRRAKRILLAGLVAGWLPIGGAQAQNTLPLAFGMTPADVERALGVPLQYVSGPRSAERYRTMRPAGIPGLYPTDEGVVLQFRKNQLTGWRHAWQLRRLGFL